MTVFCMLSKVVVTELHTAFFHQTLFANSQPLVKIFFVSLLSFVFIPVMLLTIFAKLDQRMDLPEIDSVCGSTLCRVLLVGWL